MAELEAPPSYGDATNKDPLDENDDNAPPSYDSIYGRIQRAKSESTGYGDFSIKLCAILFGTICFTIILALLLAIPIAMIAIGSIYLHDCPCERYIPIYLIVGGVFGIIKNLLKLGQNIKNRLSEYDESNRKNPLDAILNLFLFAWFIAGSYWVYHIFHYVNNNPESSFYCHNTLYQFTFWLITSAYIISMVSCCCFAMTGIICYNSRNS